MTTHLNPQNRSTTRRRWLTGAVAAMALVALLPTAASAQTNDEDGSGDGGDYVTTTLPGERSIDVSAFSPACIRDVPYITYSIVPVGFVPVDGSATLVIKDRHGDIVETLEVTSLSGTFIYPGASVDSAGNATDWPGWKQAPDGSWIPDSSDAILREGLIIEVTVNPTATATVGYPAATSTCAGPGDGSSECVPGQNGDSNPADDCDPCVPGDDTSSGGTGEGDSTSCLSGGTLPQTGSNGMTTPLTVGGISLLAGVAALATARRRRNHELPSAA